MISRSTIASTIGGKWASSQSFSIGRSKSRVSPSREVSPDRTICGAAPGSDKVCNAEKLCRRLWALVSSSRTSSRVAFSAASVSSRISPSSLSPVAALARRLAAGGFWSSSVMMRLIDDKISSIEGSFRPSAICCASWRRLTLFTVVKNRFYVRFLCRSVNGAGRLRDRIGLR